MNPLIFWVQRIVVFSNVLNRKIPFQTVLKERSLYFNVIVFKKLLAQLQEKKPQVKILWYKDNR